MIAHKIFDQTILKSREVDVMAIELHTLATQIQGDRTALDSLLRFAAGAAQ